MKSKIREFQRATYQYSFSRYIQDFEEEEEFPNLAEGEIFTEDGTSGYTETCTLMKALSMCAEQLAKDETVYKVG